MEYSKFLYEVQDAAQFKTSQNTLDRTIKVTFMKNDLTVDAQIIGFEVDGLGDICIIIDEPDQEESA